MPEARPASHVLIEGVSEPLGRAVLPLVSVFLLLATDRFLADAETAPWVWTLPVADLVCGVGGVCMGRGQGALPAPSGHQPSWLQGSESLCKLFCTNYLSVTLILCVY